MSSNEHHTYSHPIRTVAIVGSGASGAPAARHLRDAGLQVAVFERQPLAGGIWNWRPDVTKPLSVPTPPPSNGAFFPTLPSDPVGVSPTSTIQEDADGAIRERFSPANPVYWSLSNNVPTSTMAFKDFPYPGGTAENIPHHEIAGYVHAYVKHFELDKITSYNTRVEKAEKIPATSDSEAPKWRLTLRKVEPENGGAAVRETFWVQDFDAVVVATGHYNAPLIPSIPGASAWAAAWPTKILHSSGYRVPQTFKQRTVLIVGIGTSGIDIARDLAPHVDKVYMVGKDDSDITNSRDGPPAPDGYRTMRKFQRYLVPQPNGEALPPIKRFIPPPPGGAIEDGGVELVDGRVIVGLSAVIFATGYQYSVPFLPQLHRNPGTHSPEVHSKLLVTDGGGVLNLYRDVFYIPDPTLAFLGLSVNTSAFSFFEYQSLAIARVLTGTARLPSAQRMRAAYNALVAERGEGKFAHFMGKENERAYVRGTVEWLNADARWSGAPEVQGHSEAWLAASDRVQGSILTKYGLDAEVVLGQIRREIEADKATRAHGGSGDAARAEEEEENAGGQPTVHVPAPVLVPA